ncbi:serine/threonine-protein phosphatase 4 regulatory subunit 4 isoform X2 [Parasteatoda tepidariorum]|uniref:serine/threonine-protein phosphatase 4 regulatory subunit 4 isoform X2 n=1 Tax=Parasteatoda tepidariorum TaxID=114398 RepID=UPI001C71E9F2|nr:serine/threonine-protein phosphatase 4 regulatory subunit 4 isoform X2 [Parasteatoda tepidariorum]
MWLPDNDSNNPKDGSKDLTNDRMKVRSNSPPFEGGESLCEFYLDPSDPADKMKPFQPSRSFSDRESFSSVSPSTQSDVFHTENAEKLPCKNFISLLNQDLLPVNTFTQTFLQSILSSVDSSDPVVANAWMETLLDVIDLLPKEIVKGEILTLAVNKGQMSQPVSSRLLCCKILGKICLKFDPYVIKKEVLPVVLSLCQDVDFEVRGYMCRQLDIVAKGIGLEATKSAILPELVELANDEETFVRLASIETVVQMLPLLDDAIIPLVKKLCENSYCSKDSTLPVVSKQLGRLCCGLADILTSAQKQWFLTFFQDLAKLGLPNKEKRSPPSYSPLPDLLPAVDNKDRYRECRKACAYNFPAMVLFIGIESFEEELYPTFQELCFDPYQSVRQKMACGFYEIARLLGSKACLLHKELINLLQDETTEVLKGLIPYLPECLKAVCCSSNFKDNNENDLVKALILCEETTSFTSSWRLHADFLSCLSCLPSCVSSETIFTTFVPLLFVKLHTARPIPCRTSAAYSLLVFLRNVPSLERRKGIINELIRDLCYGRSCHKRMLFIKVCELVIELFSKAFFKTYFFKPVLNLSADPVPNIRLRLCAILPRLKSLIKLPKDSSLLQELESCVKRLMTDESDKDVSFSVSKAIEELDKIEVTAEPISRRSSCIEIALDIEDRLKEEEERRQLEMEFNSKCMQENTLPQTLLSIGAVNKAGKIPVRKSGTLPKQSKPKSSPKEVLEKVPLSSQPKSLRILKKERRISSPALSTDLLIPVINNKDTTRSLSPNANVLKSSSAKDNIPKHRPHSPAQKQRTWPRQKRSSFIPKHSLDRCPSPMPPRRLSDISNKEISSEKHNNKPLISPSEKNCNKPLISPLETNCNKPLISPSEKNCNKPLTSSEKKVLSNNSSSPHVKESPVKLRNHSSKISQISPSSPLKVIEIRRRSKGSLSPSPEILKRSTTNSFNTESKIPTSSSKKTVSKGK